MTKIFCDRCKKDITDLGPYKKVNLYIKDMREYALNDTTGFDYEKTLCPECATDIMNIVEIECDEYELYVKAKKKEI